MVKIGALSEYSLYFWAAILVGLFAVIFDLKLGIIYGCLMLASWIAFEVLKSTGGVQFKLNGVPGNSGRQLFNVLIFLGIFVAISVVLKGLFPQYIHGQGILFPFKAMAQYDTYLPVLANNIVISFIVFTLLIPYIETVLFFGRGFEFITRMFNVPHKLTNIRMISTILIIGIIFTYFHLTVRGIPAPGANADYTGLVLTFLFGVVSCVFVVVTKEIESAAISHVGWNGLAMLSKVGLLR